MTDLVQRLRNPASYTNWATADAYMREAADEIERLRAALAAHAAPAISTEHGPWLTFHYHSDETYCKRCLVRSVFADSRKCEPHIVYPPTAAPTAAQPVAPLRRGVNGVCTRSICECERQGLGDQCVWLSAAQADTQGGE